MTAEPHLQIEHVTKRYPGVVALDDVSLSVRRGSLHAIVGENGAGKSTLMKILAGVVTQYEGCVRVAGREMQFRGTRDAEAAGISIIHQELNLVEELSVAANVFLGRERRTAWGLLDERAMLREATALLAELECAVPADRPVGRLRVGDQQLVEIAKALSLAADVLILDEPTSALTEAESARLERILARLRQRGVTMLYISHKMDEVFRLADTITVLRDGRHVRTMPRAETTPREVTHLMVGREIEAAEARTPGPPGEVVLSVDRLSLPWPGHARHWRLHEVSLELRRGEIVGIAGLVGAGRTELLECLFGASREVPLGQILLDGCPVKFANPSEACRAGMALVTEDRKRLGIFERMNVGQNITLRALAQTLSAGLIYPPLEQRLAQGAIGELGIKTSGPDAAITSLSGGNQQKSIIARWLLTRPKVLLLDDPTRGVDVGAKAELYRLMDQLCRQGLAILVTSSELPELLAVSDRILVLCEGRLTGEFVRGEATEQRIMEAATRVAALAD
ncbi:MAG: sugar ABC transporter ATP-binding protein [Pirellulales bacterium]|nr:sugar ABC transporter ATP-binding protein [Pirellulales bacterium]